MTAAAFRSPEEPAGAGRLTGLFGRADERRQLMDLVSAAGAGRSGSLVVQGEAGIGKSVLLEDLAARSAGCGIGRASGIESDMELPFHALQQLCAPMLDHVAVLPAPHGYTLQKVFGIISGSPPDPFSVGLAVLELLGAATHADTHLWLIDDAQWLDRASLRTIGFVCRRLSSEHLAVVLAVRGDRVGRDLAGLPQVRLQGLNREEANRLFDSVVTGPTDPLVRERIISESRGNPLALLELPRVWTSAELVEGLGQPGQRQLDVQLERVFTSRLERLPTATRTLLTLAAAEPKGDPALLWAAAAMLGLDWRSGEAAEAEGLIEFNQRVYFRHPLVRAAAYRSAPLPERLAVHAALAEVTDPQHDPDRRAWHRASSTVAHDEDIAQELELSAERATSRGGVLAAAALLERAAQLTPAPELRAERTLAAARAQRAAGALDAALELLEAVEPSPPPDLRGAHVERLRGKIAFDQKHGSEAAELLLSAARRLEPLDMGLARETHFEALAAAVWSKPQSQTGLVTQAARAARALPPCEGAPTTGDLLLQGLARRITEGYEAAAPELRSTLKAVRDHNCETTDFDNLLWMAGNRVAGMLAVEMWDFDTWNELAHRQVNATRQAGALVQLQFALNFLANNIVLTGDVRGAEALVDEERWLATITGVPPVAYGGMLVAAHRGDPSISVPMVEAAIAAATQADQGRVVAFLNYANAVLNNGLGRHASALVSAQKVIDSDALGYQTLAIGELAEAACRLGDVARLEWSAAWMRVRAQATSSRWALAMSTRVRALSGPAHEAEGLYRQSINHFSETPLRVELARSHLLLGEWLRRSGDKGGASEHLGTALDAFRGMGLEAFAKRARRELVATRSRRSRAATEGRSVRLTQQELEIAVLTQKGLSNREIGARLFLSHRTVEWHLGNVFSKVGVDTRRHLRDANLDPFRPVPSTGSRTDETVLIRHPGLSLG